MNNISSYITSLVFILFIGLVGAANIYSLPKQAVEGNSFNGERTRLFESRYDENAVLVDWSKNFWGMLDYVLLDEGLKGVIVGKNGWLFSSEEFYSPTQSSIDSNIHFVKETLDSLSNNNINLKVVLIPEKAEVYSNFAPDQKNRGETLRLQVTKQLDNIGIEYLDLFPVFMNNQQNSLLFLKTDTHWSPDGARIAATAVASTLIPNGEETFTSQLVKETVMRGDLLNFVPVAPHFSELGPKPDRLSLYTTNLVSDDVDDLFSDMPLPELLLVGTSYSANPNWNFSGFIKEATSQDLIDMSSEGEGPFIPMKTVLDDPSFMDGSIRTILWEIPVRYFESEQFNINKQGENS